MKNLFWIVPLLGVLSACSTREGDYFKQLQSFDESYTKDFQSRIVDTLKIDYMTDKLKIKDYSNNRAEFLMARGVAIDTILRIDKTGRVVKKLNFLGNEENKIGNSLFGVAYYQDTLIFVASQRGFFWYDLEGNFVKKLTESTPLLPYGISPRRKIQFTNGNANTTLHLKAPEEFNFRDFNENFVNEYSSVTNYNLTSGTYELVFPFEESSIYRNDNKYFGSPTTLFEFNQVTRKFYVLQYPDPQLFIYDEDFTFLKAVNLKPDHFQIEVVANFNNPIDFDYRTLNSRYISIDAFEEYVLIVYNSGIPLEEWRNSAESRSTPILYRDFMKYYGILLKDDKVISDDFMLPHGSIGVARAVSLDEIYFNTNPYVTEVEEPFLFFKVSLEEK